MQMHQPGKNFDRKLDRDFRDIYSYAAAMTHAASKQTYYTIRYFVDRQLVKDAYLAYAYFRWVDNVIDAQPGSANDIRIQGKAGKLSFLNRQKELLDACSLGMTPDDLSPEERMLDLLVKNAFNKNPGLQSYLHNMLAVMEFDASRRDQLISQADLAEYSHLLATAITDALHHFIGHADPAPSPEARYLAVTAAHITHMLRDTLEDTAAGYWNIPGEYLHDHSITVQDIKSLAYRQWICSRVKLAHQYFKEGKEYIAKVKNLRCRLAGYAYVARFEWMLRVIERDNFCLRLEYRQRKSLWTGIWMGWATITSLFSSTLRRGKPDSRLWYPER